MSDAGLNQSRSYWLPFVVFAALTTVEGYLPLGLYPWAYGTKVFVVTAVLLFDRRALEAIKPAVHMLAPAVVVGVLVFAQWVLVDKLVSYPTLGSRIGYNPLASLAGHGQVLTFLTIRLFGLVVLVPIVEELFWRGFAIRYFTHEDFERVPMGTFSATAFCIVTIGSSLTHPEWLVAVVAFSAYAWLLRSTRSLFAVIFAHAVTNAALGVYILATQCWNYW
jgi:hypothetical protein